MSSRKSVSCVLQLLNFPDIKEESPAETFTNSNLNIHIAMENPPAPVIQPPLPLGDMIKTETISPTNSPFYSANNTLPTGSPGIEPSRTPAKKIVPSATDNFTQGSPADLNRGQQSFTEEELPAGSHLAQWGNCPHCGQKYSNQSALKYHVRLVHSDLTNRLCCYLCPRAFTHRDSFKKHMWERHKVRI
uniref:C2H2-type domain-containing protein n=1 Tax=Cacopsylla melanoneura TaxID=428564 RepID=A0A8D9DSS3_9HEMI